MLQEGNKSPIETKHIIETWFGATIRVFTVYEHFFDGGPSDNWGIETLTKAAEAFSDASQDPAWKGCFIFLIDAYPEINAVEKSYKADTRQEFGDYFLDSNALDASDVLFKHERREMLGHLQKDRERRYPFYNLMLSSNKNRFCTVWHIAFGRLWSIPNYFDYHTIPMGMWKPNVAHAAPLIKTRYKLTGLRNCSSQQHQDVLRAAAWLLINEDAGNGQDLREARSWFQSRSLDLKSPSPMQNFDPPKLRVQWSPQGKQVYCQ